MDEEKINIECDKTSPMSGAHGVPYDPGPVPHPDENPNSPPRARARLTMVSRIHHQKPFEQPFTTECTWSRTLYLLDRAITKDVTLKDNEWTPVDVSKAGMVVIQNPLPRRTTYPTDEEKAEDRAKIIDIAFWGPENLSVNISIPPGESAQFSPMSNFSMKCRRNSTQAVVVIYPE